MFTKKQVENVMIQLQQKCPCFVSEAHLQTAFIIEAAKQNSGYEFLPEFTPGTNMIPSKYKQTFGYNGLHFDLLILDENEEKTLIEFKYKTKKFLKPINNVKYDIHLKEHAAENDNRYDCWKDIFRIEQFVKNGDYDNGFFIFITNNYLYWNISKRKHRYGNQFSVARGTHVRGKKTWMNNPSNTTIGKGRQHSIDIINDYDFKYDTYYKFGNGTAEEFKQLIVEIR